MKGVEYLELDPQKVALGIVANLPQKKSLAQASVERLAAKGQKLDSECVAQALMGCNHAEVIAKGKVRITLTSRRKEAVTSFHANSTL